MIPIKVDIIPKAKRPGYTMVPEFITVHQTGNTSPGANARAHNSYIHNNAPNPSWHYTVDDHEAYQHLPLNENGWHAGDGVNGPGNRKSVGIEICINIDGDLKKSEENGAWLVAKLIREIPSLKPFPGCVKQHYDWSGKNCPAQIRSRANGWSNFLGLVQQHLQDEQPEQDDNLALITGQAVATREQARTWLNKKAPDWVLMADLYYSIAPKYNIRSDVALAQACKETGFFSYGGLVQPWQNNFCGLGATGQASDGKTPLNGADPERVRFEKGVHGAIFVDRATGVEAHIQHLYAYATKDDLPAGVILSDPRFTLVQRGTAKYVEHLGAGENPAGVGWAYPGHDYGKSIMRDYLKDLLTIKVPIEVLPQLPAEDLTKLEERIERLEKVLDQIREALK